MSLEETYRLVKAHIPKTQTIDSLGVVKQVEEYRQFWKPTPTACVILLAESHVYTKEGEFASECNRFALNNFIQNYPTHYVRFVYCLGYGERDILNKELESNSGTPQFWKIFSSCIAKDCKNRNDLGFGKILKSETPITSIRLRNKVNVLQEMKNRGIWLLDASIVGIYKSETKMSQEVKEKIITTCWDAHIENVILESQPKHIIVIGKGVEKILKQSLDSLRISYTALPQPQRRGTSEEQLETYREYQRICSRYCQ